MILGEGGGKGDEEDAATVEDEKEPDEMLPLGH